RDLLSRLTVPKVRAFQDDLAEAGRSAAMIRRVTASLGAILAEAQERGLVNRNVVRELSRKRGGLAGGRASRRHKKKLEIGVDIPTPDEIKAITSCLAGRYRPVILTAIFTGLRASEIRGIRWSDIDFGKACLHVRQRADRYDVLGSLKSRAAIRTVPLPPIVLHTLKEWRQHCPNGESKLVFPNGRGNVESLANIINRGLVPPQLAAGVIVPGSKMAENGEPVQKAKYTGMHSLRHFYASWLINRKQDGGLELPLKIVQERMGHSSIVMTMDVYGHLFPQKDSASELEAAQIALLGE
ncbi:MAG: tyrosine-type recombinase/integrase, partial [Hyphomicrobiales bacterium]